MPSNPSSPDHFSDAEPSRDGFAEVRRDLLSADSAGVRAAAARKLGAMGNQAGVAVLIAALHDDSPEVRSAAVEALRLVGDATALGPLSDLQEREDSGSLTRPLISNAIRSITSRHYCPDAPQVAASFPTERITGALAMIPGNAEKQVRGQLVRESPQEPESHLRQTGPKKRQDNHEPTVVRREHDAHLTKVQEAALQAEVEAARLAQLDTVRRQLKTELQRNRKTESRLNTQIAALRADIAKQLPVLEKASREVTALEKKKKALGVEVASLRTEVAAFEASVAEAEKNRQQFEQRRKHEAKVRREIIKSDRSRLNAEIQRVAIEEQELNAEIETLQRHQTERLNRVEQAKAELLSHGEVVIAEVVNEPEARVAAPTVVESESFSFDVPQPIPQEEEVILGHQEFEIEKTSYQQSATPEAGHGQPESDDNDKALSLVTGETGLAALNQDPSPLTLAAVRLQSDDPAERCQALMDLSRLDVPESFYLINERFDDSSAQVRNTAMRALCDLNSDRSGSLTRALREAQPDRRRRIGGAFASSGLAAQAINSLAGESREV
ncbi:MAG TPA: HEAT repeat domain-containing protein, partial [Pyrinomonadaceae bacterium]|nr:HEAT repeat domain-containing protein [Pyrinomonadaceae bacterium]